MRENEHAGSHLAMGKKDEKLNPEMLLHSVGIV